MHILIRAVAAVALAVFCLSVSAADNGKRYALIVGINDYELFGPLDCCRQDAEALATVLVQDCGFDADRLCLITDNPARGREFQPTFTNLQRRITYFTTKPDAGDTVLIYFAGHGVTIGSDGYLMPADGNDEHSGFAMSWLRDRLTTCKAASKILILDACHSGKLTRGVSGIAPSLATSPNVLVLASCKENEISYPENGHGVFTTALLEALGGKADKNQDRKLSGAELYAFVQDYMDKWAIRTAKVQTPQMTPLDAANICVAALTPLRAGSPKLPSVPAAPPPLAPAVAAASPAPAVPAPDPRLRLASVVRGVADDIVQGGVAGALRRATEARADPELRDVGGELTELVRQLERTAAIPDLIMNTFVAQKGQEIKVELHGATENMLIENVSGRSVTAKRVIHAGSGSIQAVANFAYTDLSLREKGRRLALATSGPDAALLNGILALESRQTDRARKLFADSTTGLGKALAQRLAASETKPAVSVNPSAAPPPSGKEPEAPPTRAGGKLGKPDAKVRLKPATPAILEAALLDLKKANPDEPDLKYRYAFEADGIALDLTKVPGTTGGAEMSNQGMSDITALAGLPLIRLSIRGSTVTDLAPLRGMPLRELNLIGTPVQDLTPLTGMKLQSLHLLQTKVEDLSPLQGMPLGCLAVPPSFSAKAAPLISKLPIGYLLLSYSQIDNLTEIGKMKVGYLTLTRCPIRDLTPLRHMPLVTLEIAEVTIDDLAVLKELAQLRHLDLSLDLLANLRPVKSLPGLQTLTIRGDNHQAPDLQPLTVCPNLTSLFLWGRNWGPADLGPVSRLRDLKVLDLCALSNVDVSPLCECRNLEELKIPDGARNADKLRKLPRLKRINGQPATEYWHSLGPTTPDDAR